MLLKCMTKWDKWAMMALQLSGRLMRIALGILKDWNANFFELFWNFKLNSLNFTTVSRLVNEYVCLAASRRHKSETSVHRHARINLQSSSLPLAIQQTVPSVPR